MSNVRVLEELSNRWEPPSPELAQTARSDPPERPEDHDWRLAGTKQDGPNPITHFLWGCKKCGSRAVTETASREGEHFADQCLPGSKELERHSVDPDCRQAAVDQVHRR